MTEGCRKHIKTKKRTVPVFLQVVQVDLGRSLGASRPPAGPQQSSWRDRAQSRGVGSTASAARSDELQPILANHLNKLQHNKSGIDRNVKVHLFQIGEGLTTTFTVRHGLLARPPGRRAKAERRVRLLLRAAYTILPFPLEAKNKPDNDNYINSWRVLTQCVSLFK